MKTRDVASRLRTRRGRVLTVLGGLVALGIVVAACGGAKNTGYGVNSSASEQRMVATQPSRPGATVGLASNPTIGQQVLVDANGMTLYLFVPDGTGTKTTVPAQFKPNWPQLTASGMPTAGAGVDMTKLAVNTQSDNTQQVSYNGHLLYTFINDKVPGDAMGQGLGPNNWFVLDANGNPIGAPASAQASKATVSLSTNAAIGQKVLVDSNGMTLYLFVPDGTGTKTTVPAQFKPNWPQLTASGTPSAGPGVTMSKLAVRTQSDNTRQVSYNGHLLYTFINDKVPGDAMGQGLGPNNWFVLDANGNPIGAPHSGGW